MSPPAGAARSRRLGLAGVALAAALVYADALPNAFVWDDRPLVEKSAFLRDPANLLRAFGASYWAAAGSGLGAGHYRPLTVASLVASRQLTGPAPAGFRAVNVALHAATAVLVALTGLELGLALPFALLAGLLFGLHPVCTEPVIWVVGRAEVAASCAAVAAVLLALRARRAGGWSGAAGLVLLAGMLFKESAASAVGIVLGLHLALEEGPFARRLGRAALAALPLALAVLAYLALRRVAVGAGRYEDLWFFVGTPPWEIFLTMAKVVARYLGLLLAPLTLRAHYDLADVPIARSLAEPAAALSVALAAALAALVAAGLVRGSRAAALGAWIAAALAPYLHLVPFQWLMAERFLYLAAAGFALLAALALERAAGAALPRLPPARAAAALAVALALAYAPRTIARGRDWRDEVTFFGKMVEQTPDLLGARISLVLALRRAGRWEESDPHVRAAWQLGYRPERLPEAAPMYPGQRGPPRPPAAGEPR